MIVISSSPVTLVLAALAVLAYGMAGLFRYRARLMLTQASVWLSWLFHGLTLISSFSLDQAHFGFGPALSVTAWLVLTIYGIEYLLMPGFKPHWSLALFGASAVVLGALFPGYALATENNTPWMAVHLALGIASYGLFATAVAHGVLMHKAEKNMRQAMDSEWGIPLLSLERLTFRFVTAGFVLLSATLLAGMLFGEEVYGRAWSWQHKQIFAVLAWLTFAGLLLARWRIGLRGRKALRLLYLGAVLLLLAYVGSRFVREIILM